MKIDNCNSNNTVILFFVKTFKVFWGDFKFILGDEWQKSLY